MSSLPETTAVSDVELAGRPAHMPPQPVVQRVAILLTRLDHGGKERVAVNLAVGLKQQGLAVVVICFQEEGFLIGELRRAGVETVVIPSTRGWDFRAIVRLTRVLREFRPEVLHVHDLQGLAYGCVANYFSGMKPVVMTGHGLLLGSRRKSRLRERLMARQIRLLSAVSPAAVDEYRELLEYAEEVRLIQNGVPAERLDEAERAARRARTRQALGVAADEMLVLAVGNVKPEKGYEDLLAAAAALKNRPGRRRLKFCIAGIMIGTAYDRGLEAERAALGVEDCVTFLGARRDVEDLYCAADIFVMSSRKEALPMVLLEAMSAGVAVVATSVGGIPQALDNGRCGLLCAAASPGELADGIALLADSNGLRESLAVLARQRLVASFSREVMVRNYAAAYSAAVSAAAAAQRRKIPHVLMLGPMAPLSGGMATVMEGMGSGVLSRSCRLRQLQSGKQTAEGRPLLLAVASQVRLACRTALLAVTRRHCIVHIHTCSAFSFWRDSVLAVMCRMLLKPVILHIHGGRFDDFLSGLSPWRKRLACWFLRRPSRVLVLTPSWRAQLAGFCPGARLQVMKNGVEVAPTGSPSDTCDLPQISAEQVGRLRLLYMGNLGPRKGARDLIEALGLLGADTDGIEAIVGGIETAPGQRAALQNRIDELGLTGRVRLAGGLGGAEREAAFAASDALILPSHAEGLPMAILEGMSRGMPIISTRVGGIPETIEDGVTGLLVEPRDWPALAEAIKRLAEDPILRRRMSMAARRQCELHYSLEAVGAHLVGIYDSLLNGGREP